VHLDTVRSLGTFVEFERPAQDTPEAALEARETLLKLMRTLGIKPESLQKGSYSDLLAEQAKRKKPKTGR